MREMFAGSELIDLIDRLESGERLNSADGIRLLDSNDLLAVGYMADQVRRRKHGKKAYFFAGNEIDTARVATMVYGQGESRRDRVEQLLRLRQEQDSMGGFAAFRPVNSSGGTTGFEDIKVLAVARILLDNFAHIQVSLLIGAKLAQVSLAFGVDSLDATWRGESAGANAGQTLTGDQLICLIRAAGYEPVEQPGNN